MENNIKYERINEQYYNDFWAICQNQKFAPLLLPQQFSNNLWGVVALLDNKVIGGWVGALHGNKPFVKYFSKGVWFDSYPVFSTENENLKLTKSLVDFAKQQAKKEGVILFNLTHWVRQTEGMDIDIAEKNATFIINLKEKQESLSKNLNRLFKRKIKKAEENNITVTAYQKPEALNYVGILQNLRQETQKKSIQANKNASMLLKSDNYIQNIINQTDSILFLAKYGDEIVVALLAIKNKNTFSCYLSGSNSNLDRITGASAFLHWKMIEWAKDFGLSFFDLGGVPVNPSENHPAYGIYTFKKSFGGEYQEYNSGKIIISPLKYKILNFILKNRKLLRFISKNEN